MSQYNNFHCWFPEGHYRPNELWPDGLNPDIIRDLDAVIGEMGFYIEGFRALVEQTERTKEELIDMLQNVPIVSGKRELSSEQEARKQLLITQGHDINRQIDEMLTPVYEAMLNKDYTRKDLIE